MDAYIVPVTYNRVIFTGSSKKNKEHKNEMKLGQPKGILAGDYDGMYSCTTDIMSGLNILPHLRIE